MLNLIDTFSKYAWSEPIKTKSGQVVTQAFKTIISRAKTTGHTVPKLLHADKGREFVNKDFKAMLKQFNIHMYHTENEEKSAMVERFNRCLNNKMKVQFEIRQSFRGIDILKSIINSYNNSVHRTIKDKPINATQVNESQVRKYLESGKARHLKPKLKIGDRVRITVKK